VETWTVTKPAVRSAGGLVASQHYLAAEAGAKVLREGGNAVDAAVATGLAIGAVEPWMSGLGGGGYMVVYRASDRSAHCVGFGMPAPAGLDPTTYPLTGRTSDQGFGWPEVAGDRNIKGYHAVGVPGQVAGMALALERFGTRGWAETVAPAVELAEAGMVCDWYATLKITSDARLLGEFSESRRTYLPDGRPPVGGWDGPAPRLRLGNLANTFRRLAEHGARDFYQGGIARDIAADMAEGGGSLTASDLACYRASVTPAVASPYRGATVHVAPGLTAGPTLHDALGRLAKTWSPGHGPDTAAYVAYAEALRAAYAERLAKMGDVRPAPTSTTHISVIDGAGNLVALTQTLLDLFGSRVMLPRTGIMMNNAMAWFDPRPGHPNSIGPGKWPLTNMCPTVVTRGGAPWFALGASGGRRILPAVLQLVSFLVDHELDLDRAAHQPRLDVSGGEAVTCDPRLGEATIAELGLRFKVTVAQPAVYPTLYACPNVVLRERAGGDSVGAAFIPSPWAKVARE
jgi:gamma-glutamyltranspeptidase/glutathione hydrolase